jgi:hypothetical protein
MCMQESHTHTYTHTSNSSRLSERKLILMRALMSSTSPPSARASTRGKPSTSMFDSGGNRISLSSGYCDKALRSAHVSGQRCWEARYLQENHKEDLLRGKATY